MATSLAASSAARPAPPGRVRVTPVQSAADRKAFIEFPYRLHKHEPHWIPPLRGDVAKLLDERHHPFFQHARMQLFLARDAAGTILGRVAAIRNTLHEETHHEPAGFFGFFEVARDAEAARALLDAAAAWVKAQGLSLIRGPANPSSNEDWGLLVDGFDRDPSLMMPYNPPYYAEFIEGAGFHKAKDLLAYEISADAMGVPPHVTVEEASTHLPERLRNFERVARERFGVTIRPFDKANFEGEVAKIRDLYNQAWEANWGYVPFTPAEFDHLAKQLKPVADFDLIPFAEVRGETAGFAIALPNLNEALKHAGGRLFPFGLVKLLWYSRRIRSSRVLTLGILPKYRRTGAAELLYLHLMRTAFSKGMRTGEASWILEDNHAMRAPMEKLGARVTNTYRLYDREL